MDLQLLSAFLGWCSIINFGILLWWTAFVLLAPRWLFQLHSRWFELSQEQFNAIHYAGIMIFKILWLIFNVTPYLSITLLM